MTRPSAGTQLLGRYTTLKVLGEGGMGLVVAAFDARLNRRVALKLLPKGTNAESEARLVREARAMGRLSHPNVVAVFDSGQLDAGTLFIAMEYVEGQTLQSWCNEAQRGWSDILTTYCQAARGLEAAHQSGLIHRDFKPLNVLVGTDGRARVTDFGVARSDLHVSEVHAPAVSEAWSTSLTLPGLVMGTPKYMAPEVLRGQNAGVRSDVFAFCVALYEALYQQPAFPGETQQARLESKLKGQSPKLPQGSSIPAWVGRAVLRGLSADPARRPASIRQLLGMLQPPARRAQRMGMTMALVAVVSWGAWAAHRRAETGCQAVAFQLGPVWSDSVKSRLRAAMLGTQAAYAENTVVRVEAVFDRYAESWVKLRQEVCEKQGSTQLVLLQEACLERKRRQFHNLTELLSEKPDVELLAKAVTAAQSLAPIETCADEQALTARVAPPELPEVRAQVEVVEARIGRLQTLYEAGKYRDRLIHADALLAAARDTQYSPVYAQALYRVASLEERTSRFDDALQRVHLAIPLAAESGDALTVAQGWLLLHRILGRQAKFHDALALELPMAAALEQAGDARARATALNAVGNIFFDLGRYADALSQYQEALSIREAVLGPSHPDVAMCLNNIGNVLSLQGNNSEALKHHQRALHVYESALGPTHPDVAMSLSSAGAALFDLDEFAQALKLFKRSLEIEKTVWGDESPQVATSLGNVASALSAMNEDAEALNLFERGLHIRRKVLGEEHPDVAFSLTNMGSAQMAQDDCPGALESFQRASAIRQKVFGETHAEFGGSLSDVGDALLCANEAQKSFEYYQRSLSILEKSVDVEPVSLARPMMGLAMVLTRRQDYSSALLWFERALKLREDHLGPTHTDVNDTLVEMGVLFVAQRRFAQAQPILERALSQATSNEQRARAKFTLAQALWAKPNGRLRAVALARESQEWWRAAHHSLEREVVSWLASHQLGPSDESRHHAQR
jgi:tetratricopeptide (TPR) repeat protein